MRDIKGFEGLYAITSCGKVWSYKSNKFLKPRFDKDGYLRVTLTKDGKMTTCHIHRLVAEAYIPNVDNLPEVNHKDEVKTHCWVGNLEWCTREYNVNYGTRNARASASLKGRKREGQAAIYCIELGVTCSGQAEACEKYNIDQSTLSKHLHGKKLSAGKHPETGEKLHWQYAA